MNEEWRAIPQFEDFEISRVTHFVRKANTTKICWHFMTRSGEIKVQLKNDKIATAFPLMDLHKITFPELY